MSLIRCRIPICRLCDSVVNVKMDEMDVKVDLRVNAVQHAFKTCRFSASGNTAELSSVSYQWM